MDKPLAFKEQVGWTWRFSETGAALTGILCPTVYRCPNCRKIYKVVLGPGDVFLGEGERECSKCKQAFRDRSMEWPTLAILDRFFFLLPGFVLGWMLFGFILCVVFSWVGWTIGTTSILMPVMLFFATPLIAWFVFRIYQVALSIHRFNLHGKAKAA